MNDGGGGKSRRGLILILVVLVYPTAWVFVASFRTPETMFSSGRHIYTLDNYIVMLSSEFARSIFVGLPEALEPRQRAFHHPSVPTQAPCAAPP